VSAFDAETERIPVYTNGKTFSLAPRRTRWALPAVLAGLGGSPAALAQPAPAPDAPPVDAAPPPAAPPAAEPTPPAAPPTSEAAAPGPAAPPAAAEPPAPPPAASEPPAPPIEDAPPAAEEPPAEAKLTDVVVTANKREEKIQDVATPITAASGEQITKKNVTTTGDIERISPNLSGQVTGSRTARVRWFLRGIGTNDPSLNLESPIGIYQDEVYIAYVPLQNFPLFDLERVEVLKGPQGTLWGKNTTGGAIHFVSRKPSFDPSGYVKGGIGRYGNRSLEGGYGGPVLGEWLAARGSFFYETQEGWATNLRDDSKEPAYTDTAARLQLLAVHDKVDALLSARVRLVSGNGSPSYPVGSLPGGVIRRYPEAPTTYTPAYGDNPQTGDGFFAGPSSGELSSQGATGTVNVYLGDYTLTSISAIDRAELDSNSFGYWPDPLFDQTGSFATADSRQFSQEVRITSPKKDRFNWIAGVNYINWHLFSDSATATFGPDPARKQYTDNRIKQDDISLAGFASVTFDFTKRLSATGGLRYTYNKKYVELERIFASGPGVVFTQVGNWFDPRELGSATRDTHLEAEGDWTQLTYDITPEYRITDDVLAFVRFAKGFRAGTFNPTIVPSAAGGPPYIPKADPEILYDLEVGVKTSWLDDRLVVNAALFNYWLEDIQLNVQQPNPMGTPGASGSTVQNAAGGNIKGAELEVTALPVEALRLNAGLGLLKAEYTDFLTFQGTETVDASGNAFYRTPQASLVFGADYTLPITEESAVGVGTDWLYRSQIYHNAVIQDDPVQETPGYVIGNAELRFVTGKGGRFTLQGYVKNLTDKNYKILSQVVNSGAYPTTMGVPRTYGLQFIAKL
jgi:iron complex outermembrane receptor protein